MADEINARGVFQPYCLNLRSEDETRDLARYTAETFGKIDLLVNCAGIGEIAPLTDSSRWEEIVDINLNGTIRMCRAVLPYMLRRNRGNIINISSVWGDCGSACEAPYSASKGGINAFTKALAKEVGIMGVRVNAVAPGAVDTDMMRVYSAEEIASVERDIPLGRLASPDEIAAAVLFLLDNGYVTGQTLTVDGGFTL